MFQLVEIFSLKLHFDRLATGPQGRFLEGYGNRIGDDAGIAPPFTHEFGDGGVAVLGAEQIQ